MLEMVHWLGHASFRMDASKTIFFDPWEISGQEKKAGIVLVSHEHFDHCSRQDIEKISKEDTVVVGSVQCKKELGEIKTLKPGEKISIQGVKIEAVPAYNINKFRVPGKPFHPKEDQKIGFVVEIDGKRIYHAGDTDNIPEMSKLKNIDIALLPVSGTYVMTAEEAAEAANSFRPKTAVPMHFGKIVGSERDAEKFQKLCRCTVKILAKE